MPLPNKNMGYMLSTEEGTVFYHTSGENGTGYAICPSCGRAESMDKNGDYPSFFNPSVSHRPLKAVKKDKNGDGNIECDGSPYVMKNIHLGCHSKTDVFELVLEHPLRHEYIPDTPKGKTIALTLTLALRKALAGILGVATSELGYSIRPAIIENGEPAKIIQLYDVISGGAGFASTAHYHIQTLLTEMVNNLHCPKCTHGCGECLLESDTRYDTDYIDSALALEWLGDDFIQFNSIPEELRSFSGGEYQPASVALTVRNLINHGAKEAIFWLGNDIIEWDLTHPYFKRALINYLTSDNIKVTLVLPQKDFDLEISEELQFFEKLGIKLVFSNSFNSQIVAQLINGEQIFTIATLDINNMIPGNNWHCSASTVILTKNEILHDDFRICSFRNKVNEQKCLGTLEFDSQLNGKLINFGDKFWKIFIKQDKTLWNYIGKNEIISINYSDRYLQSPTAMLLIAELISALCRAKPQVASIVIETLYQEKESVGRFLHHDWEDRSDFIELYKKWVNNKTGVNTEVLCHSKRKDIPHRRCLVLQFKSGVQILFKFDQGVGYWQLYQPSSHYSTVLYDFRKNQLEQLDSLRKLEHSLAVRNVTIHPRAIDDGLR